MLDRDATAECRDAVDRLVGDGFGVVEEPVQALQRNVLIDLLEDVQRSRDRLVIGRMHAPRPAVLGEHPHDAFEIALHFRRHVRPLGPEILKIGSGEDEHLARSVVPEVVVALLVAGGCRPAKEVLLLLLRLLGEQVVGQADGEQLLVRQLLDHRIVVRIVLEAAAGVDRARDAEPVEFAHEMARGIELVVKGEFGALGERRVQDGGVRLGQQQSRRVAGRIAHDVTSGRRRRLLRIADGAKRRGVEQCAIVEMQEEDRRIRRDRVDLVDGRQALLGELMLGEPANDAHPLRRGRHRNLSLQHVHSVGKAAHAVPAQLHVEVQTATDDVEMVVDQAGKDAAPLQVDHSGIGPAMRHDLVRTADRKETAVLDGDGLGARVGAVEGGHQSAMENEIGSHAQVSDEWGRPCGSGEAESEGDAGNGLGTGISLPSMRE